jgi:anti-sigma-K factor RskA
MPEPMPDPTPEPLPDPMPESRSGPRSESMSGPMSGSMSGHPHPDLGGYVLGALTPDEERRFQEHLADCSTCRAEVAELAGLPRVLEAVAEEPSEEVRERTFAAIRKAAEDRTGRTAAEPDRTTAGWRALLTRRPALVAAVLVLLAVAVGVLFGGRDEAGQPVTVPLVAVAGERGSGEATISRSTAGLTIRLSVEGLAPNPPRTYYECWYVGEADSGPQPERVTGGTFIVGPDGTAQATMTTAADYRRYAGIAVTLETDDGDPGTTGPVVLVSRSR